MSAARRDVVACVVTDTEGRMLVGRRPQHKRHGGLWEFPGGKVRDGETLAEAADRELREELSLRVVEAAGEVDFVADDPGSPFRIVFLRVRVEGSATPLEHEELAWFDPRADLPLDFAPADLAYLRSLAP